MNNNISNVKDKKKEEIEIKKEESKDYSNKLLDIFGDELIIE